MKKLTFYFLLVNLMIVGCSDKREQKQAEKKILSQEIIQALHDYYAARNELITFNCTQRLAKLKHIPLSTNFYRRQQEFIKLKKVNHARLYRAIKKGKKQLGSEFITQADEFTQTQGDNTTDVTWEYCNCHQEVTSTRIEDNFAQYQAKP